MALTLVADKMSGNNFTFNARAADGVKIITGTFTWASTYQAGGMTVNLAQFGLNNVYLAIFTGNDSERLYHYDYTTSMLLSYNVEATWTANASLAFTVDASDTALTGDTGYFVAFGT